MCGAQLRPDQNGCAVCILGAFKINVGIANEPDVGSGWDICTPKRQVYGVTSRLVSRGIVGTDYCTEIVCPTKMGYLCAQDVAAFEVVLGLLIGRRLR